MFVDVVTTGPDDIIEFSERSTILDLETGRCLFTPCPARPFNVSNKFKTEQNDTNW